jgi:hypothetical protein
LIAARDPLGYHPLFFAEQDDRVLLSTSQEALLDLAVTREVNRAAAAGWVCLRWIDARQTLFTEISRLLPGHWLRISGAGLSIQRYWNPRVSQRSHTADFEAVHREFDALLRTAVGRCLDLGPVGIYLSGGIDSTTIASVATEISRERGLPDPWALSLQFPDPESDESTVQRAVAEALGLPQVLVSFDEAFGPEGGLIETLRMAAKLPTPPIVPWDLAYDHLARQAVDRDCHAILGGGWSEWLHADWALAADLLRRLDLAALHSLYNGERRYYQMSRWTTARRLLWRSGARLLMRQTAAAALHRLGADTVLDARRRRRLLRSMPRWIAPEPALRRELAGHWASMAREPVWADFYRRARIGLLDSPDTIVPMDWYHNHERRLGVQLLEPFQDPDLVEFLFSMPPKHLFFGGRAKALAEASIRRRVPGFASTILRVAYPDRAFESMLVHDGAKGLELLDGVPVLSDLEIVDPKPLVNALRTRDFSADVGYGEAWQALALEAWLQDRLRRSAESASAGRSVR